MREKRPHNEIKYKYEQGELLAELQRVANKLEHFPTQKEMKEQGQIYPSIYEKRFGSWHMALACITDPSPEMDWDINNVSPEDGGWAAGIADGESTFRLANYKTSFVCIWGFQLRADDVQVAQEIKSILGLQRRPLGWWIRDNDRKKGVNAGDAVRFFVRDIPTLRAHIIPFFTRFKLRSKKQKEFLLFSDAVNLLQQHRQSGLHKPYSQELKDRLSEIKEELQDMKKYKKPSDLDEYQQLKKDNPGLRRMPHPKL
jgi:hypothetical protein